MSRKLFFIVTFFFVFAFIIIAFDRPASASISKQEENPAERVRPDRFAYHGKEEILHLVTQDSPELDSLTINSTVDQWSKMTFESYIDNNWEIYYASGSFTNLVRLTNNNASDIHPRLNRGASRIAFASYRDGSDYEIYTMNTDGSNLVRLTNNSTDDVKPAWSPDGTKIAFQSYRDGNAEVYVMHADGSGLTRLTYSGDYNGEPSWSPDGSHIAFTSYRNSQWRIWLMDANGANQAQLSQQPYSESPIWSPDGTQIVYDADQDGDGWQEIWTMNSNGSNQVMRGDPPYNTTYWANGWSPDSEYLTYTSVHMVYYYGNWYWDSARLIKLSKNNSSYLINPNRDTDWELDWTTADTEPPTTGMNPLFSPKPYQFIVSWWGQDNLAGIGTYSVQVREGPSGAWNDWQSWTTETSAIFTGVGGHEYYFRVRGRDKGFNTQPWPTGYQVSARIESTPPLTWVNQLDPLIRGNKATLTWDGVDIGGSGIETYDLQYMVDLSGTWKDWLSGTITSTAIFIGAPGHTYNFRSRGRDFAQNVESWPSGDGDASTSLYTWRIFGTVSDNTGVPIAAADVWVDPPAFLTFPSDIYGSFSAYQSDNSPEKTISWSHNNYGTLPPTTFGSQDVNVDVYLPPADNIIQDWGFESGVLPGSWQAGGYYTPDLITTVFHTGEYASLFGPRLEFNSPRELGSIGSYINSSSMDVDQQGIVHVAWADFPNSDGIYYVQRQLDGSWTSIELIDRPSFSIENILMDIDIYGNVYLLWSTDYMVYYAIRDQSGTWSTPEYVTNGFVWQMTLDDANTLHVLVGAGSELFYLNRSVGLNWLIDPVPGSNNVFSCSIVVGDDATIHIVWSENSYMSHGVYYIRREANGNWSVPDVLSQGKWASFVNIVLDSSGLPHSTWVEDLEQLTLHYSHQDFNQNWSFPIDISGGIGTSSANLLIDDEDILFVVWTDTGEYSPSQVYFTQRDSAGNWSSPQNISTYPDYAQYVQVKMSELGDLYAVWEQLIGETRVVGFARMIGGVWQAPTRLTNTGPWVRSPDIALDKLGAVHIVYASDDGNTVNLDYIGSQPIVQDDFSSLSQSITIPLTMTEPTISFLASFSGISDISGDKFQLLLSSNTMTETVFSGTISCGWQHFWFDLSPWSGQSITITFQLTENTGFPPASALLDEVTLGAAHSDVWVALSGALPVAKPGDQFTYQLDYGNHGGIPASSTVITLTLPLGLEFVDASLPPVAIGDQLVWQLVDLPPGSTFYPISITVEVASSAPLFNTVVTTVDIITSSPELEQLNNFSQSETYLGYLTRLPFIRR
ncbi:MAG: hypothetical protein WAV05_16975 [Anaerolineales bacterium]